MRSSPAGYDKIRYGRRRDDRCIMQKKLTITLDQDVYDRLCRVVGKVDDKRCAEFILEMVRGRVCSPFTNAEAEKSFGELQEAAEERARAYLKSLYQSGQLDLARQLGDPPQWVELAYQAMLAGDSWEGSAVEILKLGYREMADDEEREAETEEWVEGLIGDVLPAGEVVDESR